MKNRKICTKLKQVLNSDIKFKLNIINFKDIKNYYNSKI